MKSQRRIGILTTGILLFTLICIFAFQRNIFHSDDMMFLFYAQEMAKQHRIFPEGFHYTTEIFGFGPSYLMVPFISIIHNWLLLHEVGSVLFLLFTIVLIFFLFWKRRTLAYFFCMFILIPWSYTYADMMFYQSAYTCTVVWTVLWLIGINLIYQYENGFRRQKILSYIFLLFILIIINFCGIRSLFYLLIPYVLAMMIDWTEDLKNFKLSIQIRNQKLFRLLVICIFIFISLVIFYFNKRRLGYVNNPYNGGFLNAELWIDNIGNIIAGNLALLGYGSTNSLFAFRSFYNIYIIVFWLFITFYIPVYWISNITKIQNYSKKMTILFAICSEIVQYLYFFLCGGSESRYYITILIVQFLLLAYYADEKIAQNGRKHNTIIFGAILVLILGILNFTNTAVDSNWTKGVSINNLLHPKIENKVVDYLETNNLSYGYATFWRAYSTMMASNGSITIAAYDQGNPLMPYYFDSNTKENIQYYGCSEDLYNPKLHPGRCFLMIADGESIPEEYYEKAISSKRIEDVLILIYDKNINELFQNDVASYISIDKSYCFQPGTLSYDDRSFYRQESIYLLKSGKIKTNSLNLKKGIYSLKCKTQDNIIVSVYDINEKLLKKANLDSEGDFLIEINQSKDGYYLILENDKSKIVKIDNIVLEFDKWID